MLLNRTTTTERANTDCETGTDLGDRQPSRLRKAGKAGLKVHGLVFRVVDASEPTASDNTPSSRDGIDLNTNRLRRVEAAGRPKAFHSSEPSPFVLFLL